MINEHHFIRDLDLIREKAPLIHNITNFVVMNNTANALLAIGASPVMAHALPEVEDMTRISSALVINIGTLNPEWVEAMILAGKVAREKNIPVIFDPVGAGATPYRKLVCKQIIEQCQPTIIRGNASEILSLYGEQISTKGVDSTDSSAIAIEAARTLATSTNAVVVVSGQTDYITNGLKTETVKNGDPMMAKVTGMGCTASAIVAAFAAINSDPLEASLHGMLTMGLAGEIAMKSSFGNGSLQLNFLDELSRIDLDRIYQHLIV